MNWLQSEPFSTAVTNTTDRQGILGSIKISDFLYYHFRIFKAIINTTHSIYILLITIFFIFFSASFILKIWCSGVWREPTQHNIKHRWFRFPLGMYFVKSFFFFCYKNIQENIKHIQDKKLIKYQNLISNNLITIFFFANTK